MQLRLAFSVICCLHENWLTSLPFLFSRVYGSAGIKLETQRAFPQETKMLHSPVGLLNLCSCHKKPSKTHSLKCFKHTHARTQNLKSSIFSQQCSWVNDGATHQLWQHSAWGVVGWLTKLNSSEYYTWLKLLKTNEKLSNSICP